MHHHPLRILTTNFLLCLYTPSTAKGLPLGIVVMPAGSADVIHKGTTLNDLLPKSTFYGNNHPINIMIDDSSAETDGLHQMRLSSNMFLCTFHFLQSMALFAARMTYTRMAGNSNECSQKAHSCKNGNGTQY